MRTIWIEGETLPEVYHKALFQLDICAGGEAHTVLKINKPLQEPMISKCMMATPYSLEQYRQEILYGILDFEVARGNWHYTYHQRMEEWKQGVIDELKRDKDSRRAVMSIRDNEKDEYSKNPACLQSIQYMIREGELHSFVLFRSNDAVKASFMNMFALIMLQKEFADALGVPVGSYTHMANSYHCYPEDKGTIEKYVQRIGRGDDLAIPYVGCWDQLMEAEKPAIAAMVDGQRKKLNDELDKTIEEVKEYIRSNCTGARNEAYNG